MADELSLKPMTELPGLAFRVAFTICMRLSGIRSPLMTRWAPKNQWRLCSLLLWAMSKSSTLVGSRFKSSWNSCR